eukprot:956611-Pelagomonas_calceolata.AAC.1
MGKFEMWYQKDLRFSHLILSRAMRPAKNKNAWQALLSPSAIFHSTEGCGSTGSGCHIAAHTAGNDANSTWCA